MFLISYSLLWALAIVLLAACVVLLHMHAPCYLAANRELDALRRKEDLRKRAVLPGGNVPVFEAVDAVTGQKVSTDRLYGEGQVLLALQPTCRSCAKLVTELKAERRGVGTKFSVICFGSESQCKAIATESVQVLVVNFEAGEGFAANGLPAGFVVDDNGVVLRIVQNPQSLDDFEFQEEDAGSVDGVISPLIRQGIAAATRARAD